MNKFIRNRDEGSFRTLYQAHTPSLYLFVLRILGANSHEAEDVIQETWIRAVQGLNEFQWRSRFYTWLCSIALNCCRELRRNEFQRMELDAENLARIPQQNSFNIDLERAVANLPDGCREVLILHDIEGYTHQEIAGLLEISEGTSKSQLFRARAKLREALKPGEEIS